jgi:hypothetical protein
MSTCPLWCFTMVNEKGIDKDRNKTAMENMEQHTAIARGTSHVPSKKQSVYVCRIPNDGYGNPRTKIFIVTTESIYIYVMYNPIYTSLNPSPAFLLVLRDRQDYLSSFE